MADWQFWVLVGSIWTVGYFIDKNIGSLRNDLIDVQDTLNRMFPTYDPYSENE